MFINLKFIQNKQANMHHTSKVELNENKNAKLETKQKMKGRVKRYFMILLLDSFGDEPSLSYII